MPAQVFCRTGIKTAKKCTNMWVNVLVNVNNGRYYTGHGYLNKYHYRVAQYTCKDWRNALWFDDQTSLEKLVRLLYLRFAQVFEVKAMFYQTTIIDE